MSEFPISFQDREFLLKNRGEKQLANYKPLKNVRGRQCQSGTTQFQFSWKASDDESQMYHLWIYKEGVHLPWKCPYGQCVERQVVLDFPDFNEAWDEIQKVRFLIFTSDEPGAPSADEIAKMEQRPEFICEVWCGKGTIQWNWIENKKNNSMNLRIISDRNIPEGCLYFEYRYGNVIFQYEIPGVIQQGNENIYPNICFPSDAAEAEVKSRVNVLYMEKNGKQVSGDGRFLSRIKKVFQS